MMDGAPLSHLGGEQAAVPCQRGEDWEDLSSTPEQDEEDLEGADGGGWAEEGFTETRTTTR